MPELMHIDGAAVARPSRPMRRLLELGAVALGIAAGVLLAEPVLAGVTGVWDRYVVPAYTTIIENGLFAWCM